MDVSTFNNLILKVVVVSSLQKSLETHEKITDFYLISSFHRQKNKREFVLFFFFFFFNTWEEHMGNMEGDADIGMLAAEIQQGWKQIEGGVVRDGKVWSHTEEYKKAKTKKTGEGWRAGGWLQDEKVRRGWLKPGIEGIPGGARRSSQQRRGRTESFLSFMSSEMSWRQGQQKHRQCGCFPTQWWNVRYLSFNISWYYIHLYHYIITTTLHNITHQQSSNKSFGSGPFCTFIFGTLSIRRCWYFCTFNSSGNKQLYLLYCFPSGIIVAVAVAKTNGLLKLCYYQQRTNADFIHSFSP